MRKVVNLVKCASAAVGVTTVVYLLWRRKAEWAKWKEVATVDKLFVHPVKSCRGMLMDGFTVTEKGVLINGAEIGDRSFMVVYEYGRFATIRQFPRMVLIRPSVISQTQLRLEAPGMQPLEMEIPPYGSGKILNYKVFNDRCQGVDCGDEVAAWLEKFLVASNARLVFHNKRFPYRKFNGLLKFGHLGVYAKEPLKAQFQDSAAINMVSQASIDLLNTKLDSDHQVNERFFRPNILLKGCGEAFAEDTWKRIKIGSAEFVFAKNTDRCLVTTVDPETGVPDPEKTTLTTLSSFRLGSPEERKLYGNSPKFSVDFFIVKEGRISAGDKVFLFVGEEKE